jgi:hypothetical protein
MELWLLSLLHMAPCLELPVLHTEPCLELPPLDMQHMEKWEQPWLPVKWF